MNMKKPYIILSLFLSLSMGQNYDILLSIENLDEDSFDIRMINPEAVGGFQIVFEVISQELVLLK